LLVGWFCHDEKFGVIVIVVLNWQKASCLLVFVFVFLFFCIGLGRSGKRLSQLLVVLFIE